MAYDFPKGSLTTPEQIPPEFVEKFKIKLEKKTRRVGDCLIWMGGVHGTNRSQGGIVATGTHSLGTRKKLGVGRLVWLINKGPIPEGYRVTSTCRHRACVEIKHLVVEQHHNYSNRESQFPPMGLAILRAIRNTPKGPMGGRKPRGLSLKARELGINPWVAWNIANGKTYKTWR